MSLIARTIKPLRHQIVKVLAPKLYRDRREFPRPFTKFLKNHFGKESLLGVEIGVASGGNAESMLRFLSIRKLFLIDPYQAYVEDGRLITRYSEALSSAQTNLLKFVDRITFVCKKSSEASSLIPENLHFVYIDGNHQYEYVKSDIALYYPKLREDGVIGGHDFHGSFLGVCRAVMEFMDENDLSLQGEIFDWWIVKPHR